MELRITGVSKTYSNGVQAMKDVNLTISKGMYGLLGPNGAGKSTMMRILATLQEPDEGSISLGGTDFLHQKDAIRQTLGYLPQDFGVYPWVSAEKLLNHFAVLKGITGRGTRKDVVEALLRQTNLWEVRGKKLGGYSSGMRQRFGIALALLGNPELIIVDEPTSGLDPAERLRLLNLLSDRGENSIVLLSTHIVEDVAGLCTKMAVIHQGQILLESVPCEAVNELQGRIWRRAIDRRALGSLQHNYHVISTRLHAGRTVVHIYSEEHPGSRFEPVVADIEDVYFSTLAGHIGTSKKLQRAELKS